MKTQDPFMQDGRISDIKRGGGAHVMVHVIYHRFTCESEKKFHCFIAPRQISRRYTSASTA